MKTNYFIAVIISISLFLLSNCVTTQYAQSEVEENTKLDNEIETTIKEPTKLENNYYYSSTSKKIKLSKGDKIYIYKSYNKPYIKIRFKKYIGYVKVDYIVCDDDFTKYIQEQEHSSKPKNSYSKSSNHTYQTGPRGGQYYINSKGNKVYKKKK